MDSLQTPPAPPRVGAYAPPAGASFDAPHTAPVDAAASGRVRTDVLLLVLASLGLFALNVDFMMRGDAAMYADYVLLGKFDELTLHIGYYAVLWALDRGLGVPLGIPIQEMAVWLNVVCGALTIGVAYLLARDLLGARRAALLAAAMLTLSGRTVLNATTSEIYMLQTLLVLGSFLLFARERVWWAGALAGAALLVSPLSAFALLFFPALDWQRAGRVRWAVWLRLAGAALLVYVPYLVVFGRELLWGRRGLLIIHEGVPVDVAASLANVPLYYAKHWSALLLLLVPALAAVRARRGLLALTLAVLLPHVYVVAKLTSEDNVFLLTTDFFLACWLALGWTQLARWREGRAAPVAYAMRAIGPALVAAHVALLVAAESWFTFRTNRAYADDLRAIAAAHLNGQDATVISDWDGGMSLTFFGRARVVSTIEQDTLYAQMFDIDGERPGDARRLAAANLYLLETWSAGGLRRLLAGEEGVAEAERAASVRGKTQQRLGLTCDTLVRDGAHRLFRCGSRAPPRALPGT